mmetsp:Transcript_37300/g.107756  ORF Transcript_37300/g.107756 Transcript_37300/m.107756 type:complete len:606 (+) Transcript_37300:92-1909(+)
MAPSRLPARAILAVAGVAVAAAAECETEVGSCSVFPCHASRGPTTCEKVGFWDWTCVCEPGFCVVNGACVSPVETVQANVLACSDPASCDFPPEQSGVSLGMCSSGGGGRAKCFFTGVLRGLTALGAMGGVEMLSTVSGSTWVGVPYVFADRSDVQLLGAETAPAELTLDFLNQPDSELLVAQTTSIWPITADSIARKTPPKDEWIYIMGEINLAPFDLSDAGQYPAQSAADVERIKQQNPGLKDAQFVTPKAGRPAYLALGTLVAPRGTSGSADASVGLEMSPGYIGSPFYPDGDRVQFAGEAEPRLVGGGTVEAFAFGGTEPLSDEGGSGQRTAGAAATPFALSNIVGVSSYAPGAAMADKPLLAVTDPKAVYWPVPDPAKLPGPTEATTFNLGDGGNIDNAGLLPLLQRSIPKLIWVVNSYKELDSSYPWKERCDCGESCQQDFDPLAAGVVDQVLDKFGYGAEVTTGAQYLVHNQVFDKSEIMGLACDIWRAKDQGKPAVVQFTSTVLRNTWWGLAGGNKVDILLFYLDSSSGFVEALPAETREEIAKGSDGMFSGFPVYKTTFQVEGEPTAYTMRQANLLAAYGEYAVKQYAGDFAEFMA